ncbi:hypothetical protein I6F34_01210 [Bradyrhizobium sp. BRP05]|nr:hypothetical protein [Bradyrhizobium sp. BRP05]
MPDISTGWQMIQMAAEIASLHLNTHWAKTWIRIDLARLSRPLTPGGRKLHTDHLFKDTEAVIDHIWKQLA